MMSGKTRGDLVTATLVVEETPGLPHAGRRHRARAADRAAAQAASLG